MLDFCMQLIALALREDSVDIGDVTTLSTCVLQCPVCPPCTKTLSCSPRARACTIYMREHMCGCRIPESTQAVASFLAKADGVLAGLYVADKVSLHSCMIACGCNQARDVMRLPSHTVPCAPASKFDAPAQVFAAVDPAVRIHWTRRDGDAVTKGTVFGEVRMRTYC